MATKLQIYNKALQIAGQTRLSSTSENVAARYDLDVAWDTVVLDAFSAGYWNFAIETVQLSSSGTPIAGYSNRFSLPSDTLRIVQVSTSDRFSVETDYRVEGSAIYAQGGPLYVRHVSNTLAADGSVSEWPPSFVEVVAARLAAEVAMKLVASQQKQDAIWALYEKRLMECLSRDEMDQHRQHRSPTGGAGLTGAQPVQQGAQ